VGAREGEPGRREGAREQQGGSARGSGREGEIWRQRARGREGAGEGQGGKEGARESLCTLPPSLALSHALREGRRA
jgi:hypothetical protein